MEVGELKGEILVKQKPLRWFRIQGESDDGQLFEFYIQVTSKSRVLKYYGGKRRCLDSNQERVIVLFPTDDKKVHGMPASWTPDDLASDMSVADSTAGVLSDVNSGITDTSRDEGHSKIVKVFPVTLYRCAYCGKTRYSEYPFAFMWCNCSHKAYPIPVE